MAADPTGAARPFVGLFQPEEDYDYLDLVIRDKDGYILHQLYKKERVAAATRS